MSKDNTKSNTIDFHQMPPKRWRLLKKHLPKAVKKGGPGRPRVKDRNVMNAASKSVG